MILSCNSCEKKFVVPDQAITAAGRTVQCGSCGNKWKQFPVKDKINKPDSGIKNSNKKKPKLTKKKEKSRSDKTNLVDQLKALKDLYNSGDLSKEQYEKAKKKLLD